MKSVVITGTSSGIGYAAAKILVKRGFRVFGGVRNQGDAERVALELGSSYTPVLFDITDEAAVKTAAEHVRRILEGKTLDGLVNNAGISIPGPLLMVDPNDFRYQLEVNLVGHLVVTQAFAPLLQSDPKEGGRPGRIINISSILGKFAIPFLGPYCTSKYGLEAFSDSLRRELTVYGIDVVVIEPGAVKTPIWDKGLKRDISQVLKSDFGTPVLKFRDSISKRREGAYPPELVGELIHKALTAPYPRLRYRITPDPVRDWLSNFIVPARIMDRLIAWQLGLRRK